MLCDYPYKKSQPNRYKMGDVCLAFETFESLQTQSANTQDVIYFCFD